MSGSCHRCGDPLDEAWDDQLCDDCLKHIQHERLRTGVICDYCDGHGSIYGTICDIQRAMNGRDTVCPECRGSGRVGWEPELGDVHPDLRVEVSARVQ